MCFIIGYITSKPDKSLLDTVLAAALDVGQRNADATGMAWYEDGMVKGVKGGFPAAEFIPAVYDNLPKDRSVFICHTRTMTRGTPTDNVNNHPVIDKDVYLIHNGVVFGGDTSKVDSLQLVRACNKKEDLVESIKGLPKEVSGSYACAVLSNRTPDRLFLFRHTSPLNIIYLPEKEAVFFATHASTLLAQVATYTPILGGLFESTKYPKYYAEELEENRLLSIGIDLTWEKHEMEEGVKAYKYTAPYGEQWEQQ